MGLAAINLVSLADHKTIHKLIDQTKLNAMAGQPTIDADGFTVVVAFLRADGFQILSIALSHALRAGAYF